ncbi:MAG TPA: hypothetical protein PKV33_10495 [Methanothrix sp.]|nr:hypothetical protein [Methanothrix sp.]
MMDYILISLGLLGCLLLWWSFLAISGLKGFKLREEINSKFYPK